MKKSMKTVLLLTAIVLLFVTAVGGTVAYLLAQSQTVENTFEPGSVTAKIHEEFNGTVKSDVRLWNNGNVRAYMRAAIVVTWQDKDGNVYTKAPVLNTDYTISDLPGAGWTKESDGYYYYNDKVEPSTEYVKDKATAPLFTECKLASGANVPSGYHLNVEILAQAIQADGWDAEVDTAEEAFAAAKAAK